MTDMPDTENNASSREKRFGAFSGVFTPSVLTIIGVVMYLRFGWVVGNVGLAGALLVVCLSHLISVITGMSVSSIATNRTVGAGGAYFIISRSLGAPAGAAIGIPLFFAQALSVSFYVVGCSEVIHLLLPQFDPRLTGSVTCLALTLLSIKSASIAIKAQYFIMVAILLSLVSFYMGQSPAKPDAIVWWTQEHASFATVFAVFFPAVTGIMAGISMSGDLKNPRRDIPLGTTAAILVGFVLYMAVPVWLAIQAPGEMLRSDMNVFWAISKYPSLIYAGVLGATLSSAIGCILTAPRTLQAIASDGLVPRILARGYGPANEPRIGLLFTFVLAEVGILLGSLNAIAALLTMFFLVTYGMTNLACGLEKWAASPSFRPSFSVHWSVSLFGAAACFYVMSVLDLPAMILGVLVCGSIYVFAKRKSLVHGYGDARHGIWAALVRSSLLRLHSVDYHPRNWRPNLVILGGDFEKRNYLMELGRAIVQDSGIVTFFHLLEGPVSELASERGLLQDRLQKRFEEVYPNSFCRVDIVTSIYHGVPTVVQSYGMGMFEANTVMLGWTEKPDRLGNYMTMLRELLALNRSLLLVHYKHGRKFGRGKKIDIWWGGMTNNGAMMLLVAFLLATHDDWLAADVRLITIANTPERQERVKTVLQEILSQTRVRAAPHVILREDRSLTEIMRTESAGSDLALLGLRLPDSEEEEESFFHRIQEFLEVLPTTLLVCSAHGFEGVSLMMDEDETVT